MYESWELVLYALALNVPFLPFMLYPFRKKLRFSRGVTIAGLICMECAIFAILSYAVKVGGGGTLYNLLYIALHIVVFLLLIKDHIGKIGFVLLMGYNCEGLVVALGKHMEWLFAPAYAMQYYRWTFSVFLFLAEAVLIPVVCILFRMDIQKAMEEGRNTMWNYLWLVPAIFYVILSINASGLTEAAVLEKYLEPRYVFSILFVNIGMLFISHLILQFVQEEAERSQLELANQSLSAMNMQYDNMSKRIEEARRARHDLRHHLIMLSMIAQKGSIQDMRDYLQEYSRWMEDDDTLLYCGNMTANALFVYYAQTAHSNGIAYSVSAALSEDGVFIADTDLTIVFGNLLENAVEACRRLPADAEKWIRVKSYISGSALFFTIDNSFNGELRKDGNDRYLSTKHEGGGIGIQSVRGIVKKYDGEFKIEAEGDRFCVSLVMYMMMPEENSSKSDAGAQAEG